MLKKIFIGVGILVLLGLVGLGGYWYLHKTPKDTQSSNSTIFPNGLTNASSNTGKGSIRPVPAESSDSPISSGENAEPRLFQIHDKPVVSAISFIRQNNPYVRFMEQGSGNVFEYNFNTKQKVRISNTSIPEIGDAVWSTQGSTIAFRYEQDSTMHAAIGILASSTEE